jgi:hypothetical protein
VTAPHRYDLPESSCVNREIVVFNRKLHKVVKSADSARIIRLNLNWDDHTRHGMHLNISGKEKVINLISESINQLMSSEKETPPSPCSGERNNMNKKTFTKMKPRINQQMMSSRETNLN